VITRIYLGLMIAVYAAGFFWPLDALMLQPGHAFHLWQVVTYAFVHGAWWHLAINGIAFYTIGRHIEHYIGSERYLWYLLWCGYGAAAAQMALGPDLPALGMSGVIFGLLAAYACFYPKRRVWLLVMPMTAWMAATVAFALSLLLAATGWLGQVGHWAHAGGMVAGFATLNYWVWRLDNDSGRD
jgi:membrane associated rhomboid family serine protease